jgi:hypothetical protein
MQEPGKTTDSITVACKTCLEEIPADEAKMEEASDYVLYFCGLECYRIWRRQADED